MKPVVVVLCLLLLCSMSHAAEKVKSGKEIQRRPNGPSRTQSGGLTRMSEKGLFRVDMSIEGKELRPGVNTVYLNVSDKKGKRVNGANIAVTPVFTTLGQGVWEKPRVTERSNGNYRVENVMIIKGGQWDLKVFLKKGGMEDGATFSFAVADKNPVQQKVQESKNVTYERSIQYYNIPNVTLLNQNGKRVNLRALVDGGKPVIIDFIYTTCTTICPVLSVGFVNLRKILGPEASKVQFISISIDPEHDRPDNMKAYLAKFGAGPEWDFLSGSRSDITGVLKSLDAYIVDKMDHEPIYLLHGPHSEEWVRIKGLIRKADLLKEFRRVESK